MNNSDTAKKGFKTFVLTLSISLIVFSVVYYLLTNTSDSTKKSMEISMDNSVEEQATQVQGASTAVADTSTKPQETAQAPVKTTFGEIAQKKSNIQTKQVLAGATQATQSTTSVPTTGSTEITIGLLVSLALFVGGMMVVSSNPRRIALLDFERRVLKKK